MLRALLTTFTLTVLVFLGCSRTGELQGTVFIVTKGAENIKLGLVKITAIPESEISQFIENKKSVINNESNKFKSDIDSIKPEIEKNQKAFDEAKRIYDEIVAQRENLKSREESLKSNFSPYSLYESLYPEYETPEMKAERNKQKQIQKQIEAVQKQIASFEPKVSQSSKIMSEAKASLDVSKSKLEKITEKLVSFFNANFLLEGVPEGKIKAVTDADGKFSLKLPTGKYALVASADRRVAYMTENYHWLIWVDIDSNQPKPIMLTNQNMLGEDSEDSIFKFKELIPTLDLPKNSNNEILKL